MNHENPISAMPLNLFDAVAQNDYEGMISIWATGCNRALLSISRLKRAPYRRSSGKNHELVLTSKEVSFGE